jgi:hypothetical protein
MSVGVKENVFLMRATEGERKKGLPAAGSPGESILLEEDQRGL